VAVVVNWAALNTLSKMSEVVTTSLVEIQCAKTQNPIRELGFGCPEVRALLTQNAIQI
jgi:hypothetical protein